MPDPDGATVRLGFPSNALLIGAEQREALRKIRDLAFKRPVDMQALMKAIKTPAGKKRHKRAMTEQTVHLPVAFYATYSVEKQPMGLCHHLSVSIDAGTGVPNLEAVWMIADAMGYQGTIQDCHVYPEKMAGGYVAVNVIQPIAFFPGPDRPQ